MLRGLIDLLISVVAFLLIFEYMSDGRGETTSKLIKTIILGKVSVGKSSLLLKYARGDSTQQPQTTIGIDILTRRVTHQGQTYSL